MNIQDYIQSHVKSGIPTGLSGNRGLPVRMPASPIECADGFSMSVQAGSMLYCSPRNNDGPYTHFEVGFPSEREELLMPYVEDEFRPTDTVYAQVPIEVIVEVINKHGGVK